MSLTIAIIPARLGSTRFPGKVLASSTGKPLIRHVWEAASRARSVQRVVIATDDQSVRSAARGFGAESILTRQDHQNGTSRLAEAASLLALSDDTIIVNVQGDEPELDPGIIDAAVALLQDGKADIATVASPFAPGEDASNPNIVKVVLRRDGTALYFSRSIIPYPREGAIASRATLLKHVGLYVYRAGFLKQYAALPPTPLEKTEMLEQLRALENGFTISVAVRDVHTQGIDTPEQYEEFVRRYRSVSGTGHHS